MRAIDFTRALEALKSSPKLSTLLMEAPTHRRREGWAHYAMPKARGMEVLLNGKSLTNCLVADEKYGFCVCVRLNSGETYIVHGHVQIIDSALTPKPKVAAVRNFFRRPGA